MTVVTFPASVRSVSMETMGEFDGYADWMREHGLLENTISQRVGFARRCLAEWGTLERTGGELGGWLRQHDGWTARTYHGHLKSLYRWRLEAGLSDQQPMARMRRPPAPEPMPRPLSSTQRRLVLEEARPGSNLQVWLQLGMLAGLRAHEIAKVHGRDVTSDYTRVLGKGGRVHTVPTHPQLWLLAESKPRDDWWFPSPHANRAHLSSELVSLRIREHFRDLGIAGSAHRLRATFATDLLKAGVNLRVIQRLMRHRSLAYTEHYLGVDQAEVSAAIRLLAA